jgi:hypothetical protein
MVAAFSTAPYWVEHITDHDYPATVKDLALAIAVSFVLLNYTLALEFAGLYC